MLIDKEKRTVWLFL